MNNTALGTELIARGAEAADITRNQLWINIAYQEIVNAFDWPFTEVEITGTTNAGFVAVTDFRKAIFVSDKSVGSSPGNPLNEILYAELVEDLQVTDIALTGSARYWWFDGIQSRINTWPVGGTVFARYQKRVTDLSAGADTPVFLAAYHNLIIDRAMVEVYKDNDEFGNATAALNFYTTQLRQMARDYGVLSREPSYIQVSDPQDG